MKKSTTAAFLAASFLAISVITAIATSGTTGTSDVSVAVKSPGVFTAASWTAPTPGTCTLGTPATTFTCSGVVLNNGDADTLSVTVKNELSSSSATFTPEAAVVTGDTGGFITSTTPSPQTVLAGGSATFVYVFNVSPAATAESGVTVAVTVGGP